MGLDLVLDLQLSGKLNYLFVGLLQPGEGKGFEVEKLLFKLLALVLERALAVPILILLFAAVFVRYHFFECAVLFVKFLN